MNDRDTLRRQLVVGFVTGKNPLQFDKRYVSDLMDAIDLLIEGVERKENSDPYSRMTSSDDD